MFFGAFQNNAFQPSAFTVDTRTAFQRNAFQWDGYQIEPPKAFQPCAFQYGAFDVDVCPVPPVFPPGFQACAFQYGAFQVDVCPVPPVLQRGDGVDGKRKKRKRDRQREFDEERRKREELKALIERIADEASGAKVAQVAYRAGDDSVYVVPEGRQPSIIPVPPRFDAGEVASLVAQALQAQRVKVNYFAAEAASVRREVERRVALIRRRRREEELLLLY